MKYFLNKKALVFCLSLALCATAIGQATKAPKEQKVEFITTQGRIVVKLYNETPKHRDNFIKLVKQGFYDSLLFHRIIPEFMIQSGDPLSKRAPKDSLLGNGDLGYTVPAEISRVHYHKRGALSAARNNNPEKASNASQFFIVQGKPFSMDDLSAVVTQVNYGLKQELFQKIVKTDSVNARVNDFMRRGDQAGLQAYMQGLQPEIDRIFEEYELRFTPRQINEYNNIGGAPHLDLNYSVFGEVIEGMEVVDKIALLERDQYDRPKTDVRILKARLLP